MSSSLVRFTASSDDTPEDDLLEAKEWADYTEETLVVGDGGGVDIRIPFPADLGSHIKSRALLAPPPRR